MINQTLSHYRIIEKLGAGGMGEVYRAKDQKLGRDVAIKVLPDEFAKDTDRIARFQREAKLLASLNHPHIASIYGLEEWEGVQFLVLELIEGDTLADRLKRGAIPVEEALKFALQMAEALEAAHENGVIHRDLKPANIKVTPDGKVKILDFGLAKAYVGDQDKINLADSPTISAAATQQGVILGTAAYMSPEQAKGKSVDKRADIWAFGVVLFEMLTGRKSFTGETASETLASVMKSEPEWNRLPPNLHSRIRFLLERCLEKDTKNRYSSISDARVDIQKVLSDPKGMLARPIDTIESRAKLKTALPWTAAVLGIIIVGVVIWNLRTPEPQSVSRFYHELPEDQEFTNPGRPLVSVSADGTKIVYVANRQLYLRNFNELTARLIQGTEGTLTTPFFSPDGQWIGYWSSTDGQLKKITVSGGAPVTLCDATNPFGVTWDDSDTILFGQPDGIMRVSANGGPAELLVEIKEGEGVHGPQLLPNGKWVLFTFAEPSATSWDEAQIVVQSLETGERKVLISGGSDARYVPTGHLIYALGAVLNAIAFDAASLEVKGGAVPVVEGVQRVGVQRAYRGITGTANYAFSDAGMLAYVVGSPETTRPPRSLVWVDLEGNEETIPALPDIYGCPDISPDGTKVALSVERDGNVDIWVWDLIRENISRLTFDEANDATPIWTPDGKRIVFASFRDGDLSIFWKAADGTGEVEKLRSVPDQNLFPWSWSSDGKTLVTAEMNSTFTEANIGAISMEGNGERKLLLKSDYAESHPRISPDGRWMAYYSDETVEGQIFVRPFPEVDQGKWQVSVDGGQSPLWSPDGRELYYLNGDAIMVAHVNTEPTFSASKPKTLFRGNYVTGYGENPEWDISPDGKRFVMIKQRADDTSTEEESRPRINIVLNWFEELKERVPVD